MPRPMQSPWPARRSTRRSVYPHPIRLRCPWEQTSLDSRRVRHRRMFQKPTNLDPHEHVWLVCKGFTAAGEVLLNAAPLGRIDGAGEFEITSSLLPRNELLLDMNGSASLGEVR